MRLYRERGERKGEGGVWDEYALCVLYLYMKNVPKEQAQGARNRHNENI